jgi:hypothetical protein
MNVLTSILPVRNKQFHILGNVKNAAVCLVKFKKRVFVNYLIKYTYMSPVGALISTFLSYCSAVRAVLCTRQHSL